MSLGAFGTGIMYVDNHDQGGLRYQATDLKEILFELNHQGIVDTAYRKFSLTSRQMLQRVEAGRFESVPDAVSVAAEKDPDKRFEIIHCIRPRDEVPRFAVPDTCRDARHDGNRSVGTRPRKGRTIKPDDG
jgi:hypothetical protein